MPDARNLAKLLRVINSIDNPVRPKDDFANVWILVFGNYATELGKALKVVGH